MITNFKFTNSSTSAPLPYPMVDVFSGPDQSGTPIDTLSGDVAGNATGDVPVTGSWSLNMPGYYQVTGTQGYNGNITVDPLNVTTTIKRIPVWVWPLIAIVGFFLYKKYIKK